MVIKCTQTASLNLNLKTTIGIDAALSADKTFVKLLLLLKVVVLLFVVLLLLVKWKVP